MTYQICEVNPKLVRLHSMFFDQRKQPYYSSFLYVDPLFNAACFADILHLKIKLYSLPNAEMLSLMYKASL